MRFPFIQEHEAQWPVATLCQTLEVSRSGYYAWKKRPASESALRRRRITKLIRVIHAENREVFGSPRIYRELKKLGYDCSENFVAGLMREGGIAAKTHRKFRCTTTDSNHSLPVAPNRLNRNFSVATLNCVWLTDITYIPTLEGWLYLCAVEDLCSRRIVGWSAGESLSSRLVVDALEVAVARRRPPAGLIVHSDRGSQYCSEHFQDRLRRSDLVSSMSRKGNCWDNAPMESFFRTLKVELVYFEDYATRSEAGASVGEYVEAFYNHRRAHSSLGYQSPVEFEQARRISPGGI